MKRRVTVEFEENDPMFIAFMKYVEDNCLTLTSAIKQAVKKLLEK